jgi:amidophosphoribosyltransferase
MCGVVGLIGTPDAAREAFLGLTTLQHRGQDAAGILSYDTDGFHRVKNIGLVESVFTRDNIATLTGNLAIGHARYSTIGRGDLVDVQPFLLSYPYGIGMIHNGNIVNVAELAQDLKSRAKRHLLTQSDTEVVLNLFAEGLQQASQKGGDRLEFDDLCKTVQNIYSKVNGSYSIVTLVADQGLVAFRDPNGIRPLVWGKRKVKREGDMTGALPTGEAHMFASESVALSFLGYEVVRNVQPGELIFIDLQGNVHTRVLAGKEPRHCMFEWVYFASPESEIDGVPVYGARIQLGKNLARLTQAELKERGLEADIIVPVPETSRIAAIALSEELGIPYREVLIKNRYIKRTFILDSQEKRQKAVNLKLSPVRSEIEGKRVLLVDDSIVRGTTSKKIIELVRNAGAKAVYFVSTCPPIKHPCYYGIDFPNPTELIASGRSQAEIEKEMGADAVIYQDMEGLRASVSVTGSKSKPCMACLDGEYPSDVSQGSRFATARAQDRKRGG